MKKLFRKLSKKERAQSMVEFALIFPLLLLITYGIIEMGRMLFIYIALTNAAREGARHGAAAGDIDLTRTPHYADCDGILNAVHSAAFLTPLNDSDINIDYDHGPDRDVFAEDCPPYDDDGNDLVRGGDRIVVAVDARYDPIIPTGFLGFEGFNMHAVSARTILLNVEIVGTPPPPVPTNTRVNTRTPTPSRTPRKPPTDTPTPTFTLTPTETNTPTITPTRPSPTPSPTGTDTPTVTPTPACVVNPGPMAFDIAEPEYSVSWNVTSTSSDIIRMVITFLAWPGDAYPAPYLSNIQVNGLDVWMKIPGIDIPPLTVCEASEGCAELYNAGLIGYREWGVGDTKEIKFIFSRVPPSGSYAVSATFLNVSFGGKCTTSSAGILP